MRLQSSTSNWRTRGGSAIRRYLSQLNQHLPCPQRDSRGKMPRLPTEVLLAAWERGRSEPQLIGRTLALLSAAGAGDDLTALVDLSIGQRDGLLLRLRQEHFGDDVDALTSCAGCAERVELTFHLSEI